jgi:hypothetical protein
VIWVWGAATRAPGIGKTLTIVGAFDTVVRVAVRVVVRTFADPQPLRDSAANAAARPASAR